MAFKYDWEEFICNTLAKAREMAGDKAKDFEVVIAVKDNEGEPPLVHGAYNYWTGDFFAKLDEVNWENGLPDFANKVEREAEKTAKYNEELFYDEIKRFGLSKDNPDDESDIEDLMHEDGSVWSFSLLVHNEPEEHNHFFGHGGIGASVTVPFYLYDFCSGEFDEDGESDANEVEEKFLEDFAKALEKDDGVNESRHFRGRMLREGRRPVRRGRFLTEDRIRKSKPIAVIQGNYGYGWDDESSYDTDDVGYLKTLKHDFDEYRKSGHNALYRIVHKRQKLDKPQKFVKGEWLDVEDEPVKTEACGKRKKGKKVIKESEDYMDRMYEILDDMISAAGVSGTLIDAPDCPEDFSDWYADAGDEIYNFLLDNKKSNISDKLYTKWQKKLEKIVDSWDEEEE